MASTAPTGRVETAAHHWKPRFLANGVDPSDFERVLATVREWSDWGPAWLALGCEHEELAQAAEADGHLVSAIQAWQRAAWCYHFGKFLWFEDPELHGRLRDLTVDRYRRALPGLRPPGRRLEIPFEEHFIPAHLRIPEEDGRPPWVILVPGLDSGKEELFSLEQEFLARGLATLTLDGPGQSESSAHWPIRPDWAPVLKAVIDHVTREGAPRLDAKRVGAAGVSFGGFYVLHAAAGEPRIRSVVMLAGPYDVAACWGTFNPLTRGGFAFYSRSASEEEAARRARDFSLAGMLARVTQPVLVIHGAQDRIVPVEQAERIAAEAPNATLVVYPDGNHVCNNIAYKYRPLMADWLADRLASGDF